MSHLPCQPSLWRLSPLPSVLRVSQHTAPTHVVFTGWGEGHSKGLLGYRPRLFGRLLFLCLLCGFLKSDVLGLPEGAVFTVPDTPSPPQYSFQDQQDKPLPVPSSQCCECRPLSLHSIQQPSLVCDSCFAVSQQLPGWLKKVTARAKPGMESRAEGPRPIPSATTVPGTLAPV